MKTKDLEELEKKVPMFQKHIWRKGEVETLMETIFKIKSTLNFLKYVLLLLIGMVLAILLRI